MSPSEAAEATSEAVGYGQEGEVAILTLRSPPVNALSSAVRAGLIRQIERAAADDKVRAVVLIGSGKHFSAGADLAEFGQAPSPPSLPEVIASVEASPKPVVAALRGAALGGGLELAMAARARVATQSLRAGLPEVKLGMIPGAGGTQRLTRLIGAEPALKLITSGEEIDARRALDLGLIDDVADDAKLRRAAVTLANRIASEVPPRPAVSERDDKLQVARGDLGLFVRFRNANTSKFRGQTAPEAAIRAVEAAVNMPLAQGLAVERGLFLELRDGDQSRALRYAFAAERKVWKIPGVSEETPTHSIRKVGVIGAGTMGGGIAMAVANAGLRVGLVDLDQAALDRGMAVVRRNYDRSVKSGRHSVVEIEEKLSRIAPALGLSALADADLVIEAVYEDMAVKSGVFGQLADIVRPDAILASNTSYLDIDRLAAAVTGPERFLGLHFFSPANVMRLVEVVRGEHTSTPVLATAMQFARSLGKVAVAVGNARGFVGNRMMAARSEEANRLVLEGALPWQVDEVLTEFGMAMGPFAMRDLAGLDIGWTPGAHDPSDFRSALCAIGRLGQKSGGGFYDYDADRKAAPSPVAEEVILNASRRAGIGRREVPTTEILERCLFSMVNEATRILEEGKALRASDIDVVWLNGYGWPRWRGGPMWWADAVGLGVIVDALGRYARQGSAHLEPAPLLVRLAHDGGRLQDLQTFPSGDTV
jgi:3-hydroxyacyl-CoA dehydrogenase